MKLQKQSEQTLGVLSVAIAYFFWGILPIYWKFVQSVPATQVLAHRIFWSFIFVLALLLVSGQIKAFFADFVDIVHHPKKFFLVFAASAIVSVNWLTYIWAVNSNHVIETSLGYYINPLISVMLGVIVLREKLSLWQMVSFCLALIGVLIVTLHFGSVPWIALTLAISFGLYGLLKKTISYGALTGLGLETLFITPFALIFLTYVHNQGGGAFGGLKISALLMGAGVVTAIPLILFASGAKRLPLSVVGFIQYIAPTIALLLGVFLYHEPFTKVHLVSFVFIWAALIIFSLSKTNYFIQLESLLVKRIMTGKRETY
ncbi:EamA family transporter RarD [Peptococcaceae bacterium 1198_IL3148]